MTNEHNPVAVRISKIQQKWIDSLSDKQNVKLVRWLIHDNDLPLVNGFYKLESSVYGKINELPVVMLTPFESMNTFAYHLSKDWITEYEKGLEQYPDLPWQEFSLFKERVGDVTDANHNHQEKLLVELLTSYQKFVPRATERLFLLGIVPRNVDNYNDLNEWLIAFLQQLPPKIGITLIDYQNGELFSPVAQKYGKESVTITLENMDMQGAYTELMRQGNPSEPMVMVRCIVIEMGKGAAAKDRSKVHQLGKKMLEIGQNSGDITLWAYTYLVYAGFLFSFKDEQVIPLLDKAVQMLEQGGIHSASGTMLLPAYGYKAAYYNFTGHHELAFQWFIKQVTTALEQNNIFGAVSACKNAIVVAESHSLRDQMTEYLHSNFSRFYSLGDEELRPTEIYFIVAFYLQNAADLSNGERKEMKERMILLFGDNWEKRSITKISWFTDPQTLMEDAFSR